ESRPPSWQDESGYSESKWSNRYTLNPYPAITDNAATTVRCVSAVRCLGGFHEVAGRRRAMTRGSLTFKETDLRRAIKSAIKAGLHISGFEITKAGSIVVHAGKPTEDPV